jgi:hypothetical protein
MNRLGIGRPVLVIFLLVALITGLSVWFLYPRESKDYFADDFEVGLSNWEIGAEVPEDPNNPGHSVDWTIERSLNRSASGTYSVRLAIDGTQDDGAIWISHKLSLEPESQKTVNVTFQLWSPSESFNTIAAVVAYVGVLEPKAEEDFQVVGSADQAEGWRTYSYSTDLKVNEDGAAYVAFGIAVRWETTMEYFVDDAIVTIT